MPLGGAVGGIAVPAACGEALALCLRARQLRQGGCGNKLAPALWRRQTVGCAPKLPLQVQERLWGWCSRKHACCPWGRRALLRWLTTCCLCNRARSLALERGQATLSHPLHMRCTQYSADPTTCLWWWSLSAFFHPRGGLLTSRIHAVRVPMRSGHRPPEARSACQGPLPRCLLATPAGCCRCGSMPTGNREAV